MHTSLWKEKLGTHIGEGAGVKKVSKSGNDESFGASTSLSKNVHTFSICRVRALHTSQKPRLSSFT